jgi:hypothetical protein
MRCPDERHLQVELSSVFNNKIHIDIFCFLEKFELHVRIQ